MLRRIGILLAVFIAAGVVFFFRMQSGDPRGDRVYTVMEESSLPVVYMDMLGRHITLCQQEYFLFCLWVNGHIDDNNGMPRVTALDKYVTYLHLLVIDRSQFFR